MRVDRPLTLTEVRHSIQDKSPLMVFLEYPGQSVGHYFLIVGTGRLRGTADTSYIVADPLSDRLSEVEISELGQRGVWRQTWKVKA